MIADGPPGIPALGTPDTIVLSAGAFRRRIISFIKVELPRWRDRPERPPLTDESRLNDGFCKHLNSASRRQGFDAVQFCHEPHQTANRQGDIGVSPLGTIMVEGRTYYDFEQLLLIECKRLPTPLGTNRNDLEYVHGLNGHLTGGIERFKHGLHGPNNSHVVMIAYVQSGSFDGWLSAINVRLELLATNGTDAGLWRPREILHGNRSSSLQAVKRLCSKHRRKCPPGLSERVEIEHLWLKMEHESRQS